MFSITLKSSVPGPVATVIAVKWFTEFGHLNRGDMLTSEHYRCLNEKKNFSAEFAGTVSVRR
ncbi:hypothetical protein A3462_05855 [Enterobacter bugandensis]|nr:hypothetical protein A3462_05855 [Enterobacter bugandensis]